MTAREEYEACAASVRSTAITNREKEINFILARADAALREADERLAQAEAERDNYRVLFDAAYQDKLDLLARAKQAEQRVRELDRRFRDERLLRQKAESALAEVIRHPNSKCGRLSEYVYRIEKLAQAEAALAKTNEERDITVRALKGLNRGDDEVKVRIEHAAMLTENADLKAKLAAAEQRVRELEKE